MFIGLIFNVLLLGVICAQVHFHALFRGFLLTAVLEQTYTYFTNRCRKDKLWIPIYVCVLLLANFVHTTLITVDIYMTLIVHDGSS